HDYDAAAVMVDGFLHAGQEGGFVEKDLGDQDDVRGLVRGALGQDGAGRDPARLPAHDFDDAAGTLFGGHAADVGGDLHDGGGGVLDDRAVTGAMIGMGQVIVD